MNEEHTEEHILEEITDSRQVMEAKEPAYLRWVCIIVGIIIIALIIFLVLFQIDKHVTALGKIETSDDTLSIVSEAGGKISSVHVSEGDQVQKGQPLVTLNASYAQQQKESLEKSMKTLEDSLDSMKKLKQSIEEGTNLLSNGDSLYYTYENYEAKRRAASDQNALSANADIVAAENKDATTSQYQSMIKDAQAETKETYALAKAVEGDKSYSCKNAKLKYSYESYKTSLKAAEKKYDEAKEEYDKLQKENNVSGPELASAKATRDAAKSEVESLKKTFLDGLYTQADQLKSQIESYKAQIAQLGETASSTTDLQTALDEMRTQELASVDASIKETEKGIEDSKLQMIELNKTLDSAEITSNADGTIMFKGQVAEGEILPAGTAIFTIVPNSSNYAITFAVAEEDRAKVSEGSAIECAINSFPYQQYGKAKGSVTTISATSLNNDDGQVYYMAKGDLNLSDFGGDKLNSEEVKSGVQSGMVARVDIISGREALGTWLLRELNFID